MGTDITHYREQLAASADAYAQQEKVTRGGQFLSTRGGVLRVGEDEMPGNQACVIILDAIMENTLYEHGFDEDNPALPVCYAFGRAEDEMAPHISMAEHPDIFMPQNETCKGCPHAEWGSSARGKGKACQNRRRLAIIPAGNYVPLAGGRGFDLQFFEGEEHYKHADMAFLKLPVTSANTEWPAFVQAVAKDHRLPPFGVIARLFLTPNTKTQYKVNFEVEALVPDELIPVIMARHEEARERMMTGYSPFEQEQEKPKGGRGSLAGLRRPGGK